jgi:Antimicrobial peptide resistance and lipid A acylation protein PagP
MFRAVALAALPLFCWCAVRAETFSPAIVPTVAEANADPAPLPQWLEPPRQLTIQLPGMSHHFDQPTDSHGQPIPGREFNERNWGIGIQIERAMTGDWDQWVTKASFGLMKDSLDAMGAYAGYTWQKRLVDRESYSVDLGGGAFLFYRTLQFDGPHQWIPAVLPVLSAQHKSLGLGINLVAVPRVQFSGGTMPGVVYLQFTKGF